jgi:small-conductance mechanosensitive channel
LMVFGFIGSKYFDLIGLAFGVLTASIIFFFSCFFYISHKLSLQVLKNVKLFGTYFLFYMPMIAVLFVYFWYFKLQIDIYESIIVSLFFVFVSFILTFHKRSIMLIESNILLYQQILKFLPKQILKKISTLNKILRL